MQFMHSICFRRSCRAAVAVLAGLFASGVAARAAADEVAITGGTFDVDLRVSQSGPMILTGDRGFTFSGHPLTGLFNPWEDCHLVGPAPCGPGDRVSLHASWSDTDLPGAATLDGITYPHVGGGSNPSLTVDFSGSVLLPPLGASATVVAPLVFNGRFYLPNGGVALTGSGMATLWLVPDQVLAGRWRIDKLHYELGSRPGAPWVSTDIGAVTVTGRSSVVDDVLVVAGDGGDIWGTADAFRLTSQPLFGDGSVSAHVMSEQKAYPVGGYLTTTPSPLAKAGVMLRESIGPSSASVILDVKPDGEIEFMARYAAGEPMIYIGGVITGRADVWLRISRTAGTQIAASYSVDGASWIDVGTTVIPFGATDLLAGLAVTSHDPLVLNGALFDDVSVRSQGTGADLLTRGDFEGYDPPALGLPGWVSDAYRQVPAKSETHQPHSGSNNGACWTTANLDCGIYQEVRAPSSGMFMFRIYASADRMGGLVGVDVNGLTAASTHVAASGFSNYFLYSMTFSASAGDTIRVWMYSPASPGYVVIDDASLVAAAAGSPITSGAWTITPIAGPFGTFVLVGGDFSVSGTYDDGPSDLLSACSGSGRACRPGDVVGLSAAFVNETPVPFETAARGTATIGGRTYSPVAFGGTIHLVTGSVVLPSPAGGGQTELVMVTAPFTLAGTLKGFDMSGEPDELFGLPLRGAGTATAELLAGTRSDGSVVLTVIRIAYVFANAM
jgi:hypothetical protein